MSGWSSGIADCLGDKPSCVDSLCCYPCQIGYQYGALNGGTSIPSAAQAAPGGPAVPSAGNLSIMHCFLSAIGGFQCCICLLRRNIDERYNIGEGCCVSLVCAYFFPWCSLCQTHRELKHRGNAPGGICVKIMDAAPAPPGVK